MSKGRLFMGLLACFMVFLTGQVAMGVETIYVHPTEGSYHTIADGVTAAAEGDTVLVAPGDYASFTVNKKVHIKSEEGPDRTSITSGEPIKFDSPGDGASISGFKISLTGVGIRVNTGCDHVSIENNIISGCGSHGVYLYARDDYLRYIQIINNAISNNGECGIYLYSYYSGSSGGYGFINNWHIANNIITSNNKYGIQFVNGRYTVLGNGDLANNDFWDNTAGNASTITPSPDKGNIFSDPLFVNSETADFHLQATSPCIDAGSIGSVYNDPDGTRNNMGVYGGPGAANFWPDPAGGPVVTELSVSPPSVPVGGTLTLKATGKIR